jgi:two-component system CheB/CheR fusion protein
MAISKKNKKEESAEGEQTRIESAVARGVSPFPVVGIGASAGGIEALSNLFRDLSTQLGMAYVVVQHLSRTHESILPELLQNKTQMKVHKVTDGMPLEADNVYVIPPDTYMTIADGHLTLANLKASPPYYAIDHFFKSLAEVYQFNAIGIVLSGTGSDGTFGIQAIKAEGGITFAQDKSALFQDMPVNAANSGFIDFVLSPAGIAKELTALIKMPYLILSPEKTIATNETDLRKIHVILHNKRGVDFSNYKQTTINRRILRRMTLNRCKDLQDYLKFLMKNEAEVDLLYRDLLINVTSFYRDPQLYDALGKNVFPNLFKNRKSNDPIRIWIPACSTGEEACTFAICLFEFLGDRAITAPIQIFATDLSELTIEKARTGIYAKSALANVPAAWAERYFTRIDGSYQVIKAIRDVCIFATHNLLKDPPFSRMDIISCQNVMIYLESAPQKRILNAFHYALKDTGYLILGKSETIGNATELYDQLDKDLKIYTKKAAPANIRFDFPSRFSPSFNSLEIDTKRNLPKTDTGTDIDKEIDRLLLSKYMPASVVINKDMQILRFHGATANYLQPATGKASFHLLKMVRDELLLELRPLIHKAKKENKPQRKEGILLTGNDMLTEVTLEVVPVKSLKEIYFLIVFREVAAKQIYAPGKLQDVSSRDAKMKRIQALEEELKECREQVKSMSEEFEATREELQSANEEVLSSNEELQSINEELETSKEELQSSNEELTTINEELNHRNQDLREAISYTEAIVQTIREPLLVLSTNMKVQTANKAFYNTFHLSVDETEGRYFYDISNRQFNIPELKKQLNEVITDNNTLRNVELTIQLSGGGGEKVLLYSAVRMVQEESKNNRILLSMEDITARKRADIELRHNEERFRLLVQNAFDILIIFSGTGVMQYVSSSIEHILGYAPEERIGENIFNDPIIHPDDTEVKKKMFLEAAAYPHANIKSEFRLRHKNGNYIILEAVCINLLDNPSVNGIVANYRDVTHRRMLEKQKEEFLAIASHELKTPVTSIKGYTELLIDNFEEVNDKNSADLLKKMDTQVDRLTDLIKDLLDVTMITEGQLKLRPETFDLNELVKEVTAEVGLAAPKHKIIVKTGKTKNITADKERIRQVLVNLISNAVKYSPADGEIEVTISAVKHATRVAVKDHGIGMTQDMQERVFDRFFRANDYAANTFPGLGLGLFIASEIIKRHRGTIGVTSKKDEGSEFYFTLPTTD